jgi:RHS repeat-associated protein
MASDANKKISSIVYNRLDLPQVITVTGQGTVSYIYDAAGNKFGKIVNETGQPQQKITHYIAGFVYENNQLQFFSHEEGRIRRKDNGTFVFDYMLKDHLGTVRMVLTEEQQQDKYPVASLETAKLSTEDDYYTIDQTKIVDANTVTGLPAYTNDNGIGNNPPDATFEAANSERLYKLNSNANKTGLGITLKVMSGDVIDILGKSYYFQNNTGGTGANSAIPVMELLNGLLDTPGGAVAAGAHETVTATQLNNLPGTVNGISGLLTDQTTESGNSPQVPKAYINYIFLDEQFKYAGGGFSKVGNNSVVKDHFSELQNITVPKNGYVYIYVSNESPINVFFDNLQVVHTRGPLVEETHYYPFGLTMRGISSKAIGTLVNRKRYNGIEQNDNFDINLYEAFYRTLDPQIGRWQCVDPKTENMEMWSPYVSMYDNPIKNVDPMGDQPGNGVSGQDDPKKKKGSGVKVDPISSVIYLGLASIKAANIRLNEYNKRVVTLEKEDKIGRAKLKEEIRQKLPEPYRSATEQARPMKQEMANANDPNFKGNVRKTNPEVNNLAKTTRVLGSGLTALAIINSAATIYNSDNPIRETVTEGAGWYGAITLGSEWAIATAPSGPIISTIAGIGGSLLGYTLGKEGSEVLIDGLGKTVTQSAGRALTYQIQPTFILDF